MPLPHILDEIITYHLIPLLSPEDVLSVLIGCHLDVTKDIYRSTFPDHSEFDHYDLEMFSKRLHAKLYVFGDPSHFFQLFSNSHCVESVREGYILYRRIHTPCEVEVSGCIERVRTDGSLQVVNSRGKFYFADMSSEKGVGMAERQGVFIDVGHTDESTFALDSKGQIWQWTEGEAKARLFSIGGISQPISMLRCSSWNGAGFVRGTGIVVWGNQSGKPGTVLPGTRSIRDFVVHDYMVLILKRDGRIATVPINVPGVPLTITEDKYTHLGPFSEIGTNGMAFSLVSTDSVAYVGAPRSPELHVFPISVASGQDCISVSMGTSHNLLLTKDGEVYTWGYERNYSGCLGQGRLQQAIATQGIIRDGTSLEAPNPIRVALPGRAYRIMAGNGYSAVIIG